MRIAMALAIIFASLILLAPANSQEVPTLLIYMFFSLGFNSTLQALCQQNVYVVNILGLWACNRVPPR